MYWPKLPWNKTLPQFGEIFEAQVEQAVKIESELVFSGLSEDAHEFIPFQVAEWDHGHQVFIISRRMVGIDRTDIHMFVVKFGALGEPTMEWWHHKPEFGNKTMYLMTIKGQKAANEVTRILGKHWEFTEHL